MGIRVTGGALGLQDHCKNPKWGNPFSLAYGYDAIVPVEIGAGSLRRENYDSGQNFILQRRELDLFEEKSNVIHNSELQLTNVILLTTSIPKSNL